MDETYFEENDFDYTACLPAKYKARYTPVYRLSNMVSSGWKTVKGFKRSRKFLMLGFVFAAMFAFLAVSNVTGLIDVKPVDYRTTNGSYVTVSNPDKTSELLRAMESVDGAVYSIPGNSLKSITLPMDDFLQTSYAQEDLNVSIVRADMLSEDQLTAGEMPSKKHEVVLDKSVVDRFIRGGLGVSVGLDTPEEFIGRKLRVPRLDDYTIVGIADTQSPSLFVDESQVMYILTNGNDVEDVLAYGYEEDFEEEDDIKSGKVMDIALSENEIKIKKGRAPEDAFETVVNEIHDEEYELGSSINSTAAGRKLTVVGFYSSDAVDDDTYYVNSDTIREDYISKQKNISVYSDDPEMLKSELDLQGVSAKVNDVRDKKAYINERRDQLTSSIIVAVIIMIISLIEMFLMLRSSFLSRIKQVGTMRAIGLKKKDIYRMFTGEILVISFITAVPGIALMYFILRQLVRTTYYLEGLYIISPAVALITFAIILVFNLIAGIIPVLVTMRKTPAQILARTDI
jgi:hypothetical protein